MSADATAWLEEQYEAVAAALAAVRHGEPLTDAQRDLLRERRLERSAPPRPSVLARSLPGRPWEWRALEEPGPDDWRPHP